MTENSNVLSFPDDKRVAPEPSVLIVEDNVRFAKMLGAALTSMELEARRVTTAEAAYDLIRSAPPGTYPVILLDNHLGAGMYGIELMHRLRDENLLDECHIVQVVWTSTDTEVEGLWDFPGHLHNAEHGGNDTSVEELAWMASQFMPTRSVAESAVAAGSN